MKKILSLWAITAMSASALTVTSESSFAAASPLTFSVNCDSSATLNSSTSITGLDENRVISGTIGDTFTVTNTALDGAGDCTVALGEVVDTPLSATSIGDADGTLEFTIAASGTFTIAPAGGDAVTFVVDTCSLSGSGIDADPWLVGSQDDLEKVGEESAVDTETSCGLDGSYLQTANITDVDTDANTALVVGGDFTGTYNGDHYTISYYSGGRDGAYEGRDPLFSSLGVGGTIKRLNLTGNIKNSSTYTSSLVNELAGGTLSEISSSVWLQVDDDSDAVIGGLAARSGLDEDSFIRYSKFDGRIEWVETNAGSTQEGPTIGGFIGIASGSGVSEIRDSYSRAAISFDSSGLTSVPDAPDSPFTDPDSAIYAGGLVGSDGENELSDTNESDGDRVHEASHVRLVRTYFAGSFSNLCEGLAATCNIDTNDHVFVGGLIGVSEDLGDTNDLIVSSFWLSSSATNAVGEIVDSGNQPKAYTDDSADTFVTAAPDVALPEAAPLSTTLLKVRSTYQSLEDDVDNGSPSGEEDLPTGASTDGTLTDDDYRWAIESGNVRTFVASQNAEPGDFLQRALYADTTVEQSYRREGAGDLTVHGGEDPETVINYPTLGRVWEICSNSNNGYPFLVWEELDCSAPGGGSSDDENEEAVNPGGLSDEEYAAFLASGLTLDQFLAQRLAATGADALLVGLGGIASLLLLVLGALSVWVVRRERLHLDS